MATLKDMLNTNPLRCLWINIFNPFQRKEMQKKKGIINIQMKPQKEKKCNEEQIKSKFQKIHFQKIIN